jgi:alkanesulfonate monooxygenase SsuD/methylene tetrahydromethanopterin reductase-like flavin-dependent oxidoreductase (luciferase family)
VLIDVQLSPAAYEWSALRDLTLVAEAVGFDTAWVFDHLSGASLGGASPGSDGMLECFTLAGALAAATSTIRLGSLVTNVANRPLGVLATAAGSVQAISGGRFTLGLGAGAAPGSRWAAEHDALGIALAPTIAARHERVGEAFDLFDALWRPGEREARFDGMPNPSPRPPVIVGANSDALATLAGQRADGINVNGRHPRAHQLLTVADGARADRHQPWDASVWAFWDDALLDADQPDRHRWASWGIGRLILVALTPLPVGAIERATGRLR